MNCQIVIKKLPNTKYISLVPEYFALPTGGGRSKLSLYDGKVSETTRLGVFYGAGGFDDTALSFGFHYFKITTNFSYRAIRYDLYGIGYTLMEI